MPNLFIVGAPKCGTTALSNYLAGHPMVFMSEQAGLKEPHYFCSDANLDHFPHATTRTLESYLALFKNCGENMRYLGEATPIYLASRVAIGAILEQSPAARLIVLLRNPLELAEATHNEFAKYGMEIPSFEAAWRLQEARMCGLHLPPPFKVGGPLQYGRAAKIGEQVQRLLAIAPREQVHFILQGDLARDPAGVYRTLLRWLDLPDDDRAEFPRLNPSAHRRFPKIEKYLLWLRDKRHSLGLPGGLGIHALIEKFNRTERQPLRPEFVRELRAYFREDVALLTELIGRDLTDWTAVP
jgi:hypothetical protein